MNIAVCGLGMMGQAHLANLLTIEGATLGALCDTDPQRLELPRQVAGNLALRRARPSPADVPRYDAFDRMLAEAELDAVVLAVPTHRHAELAITALGAGLHVFCEKPLARTVPDAERMCRAARDARKLLFIGHVVRFFPAYRQVRDWIRSGQHGRVLTAEFSRACGLPGWGGDSWFTDPAKSGGMPVDLHIHDADFVLHAFGPPPELVAFRANDPATGVDVIRTVYLYGDTVVSSCGAWLHRSAAFRAGFAVVFEQATVHWHIGRADHLHVSPAAGEDRTVPLPPVDGYEAELREFIRCVESGQPSEIATAESALDALRLVHREMDSAQRGEMLSAG